MKMVTPLKKAKGLGSAKESTGHWWAQRVSALALIVLTLWVVYAVLSIMPAHREALTEHVRNMVRTTWPELPAEYNRVMTNKHSFWPDIGVSPQ